MKRNPLLNCLLVVLLICGLAWPPAPMLCRAGASPRAITGYNFVRQ
jgi:hypothetical protein